MTRSRLVSSEDVYARLDRLAAACAAAGLDLWAANLRSCARWPDGGDRLVHLRLELTRLENSPGARRVGLLADAGALGAVVAAAVDADEELAWLPLYAAVRDLTDYLELEGGRRWLRRLRAAGAGEAAPEHRLRRLRAVIGRMGPGTPGLPAGTAARVAAAAARLDRVSEVVTADRCVRFALAPPA